MQDNGNQQLEDMKHTYDLQLAKARIEHNEQIQDIQVSHNQEIARLSAKYHDLPVNGLKFWLSRRGIRLIKLNIRLFIKGL